jgi:hypothetical protein
MAGMIEFFIYGTDTSGRRYPTKRGMGTCMTAEVIAYRREYPPVVHVNLDMVLAYDENTNVPTKEG